MQELVQNKNKNVRFSTRHHVIGMAHWLLHHTDYPTRGAWDRVLSGDIDAGKEKHRQADYNIRSALYRILGRYRYHELR